jgi:proprotein convertase subtilisin/kexin type 5
LWIKSQKQFPVSLNCASSDCGSCHQQDKSQCDSCQPGKALFDSKCISQCPVGFFRKEEVCSRCSASCLDCTNSTLCTKCPADHVLLEGACLSREECLAKPGMFAKGSHCQKCELPCLSCADDGKCLECDYFTFLVDGSCRDQCPADYDL